MGASCGLAAAGALVLLFELPSPTGAAGELSVAVACKGADISLESEDTPGATTPFGSPLCFALSAKARFMVLEILIWSGKSRNLGSYQPDTWQLQNNPVVCVFTLVSLAQALLVSFKGHKCKRHENNVSKKSSWCRNGLEIVPHLCHV